MLSIEQKLESILPHLSDYDRARLDPRSPTAQSMDLESRLEAAHKALHNTRPKTAETTKTTTPAGSASARLQSKLNSSDPNVRYHARVAEAQAVVDAAEKAVVNAPSPFAQTRAMRDLKAAERNLQLVKRDFS